MASFGKISSAMTSVTNENTAALINVNLDFSLIRCDPLPEFQAIGPAISIHGRKEAESGQIRKTACTLGFLFQELLPETTALFRAYGRRVSELLDQPEVNPKGTASDGPFKSFIGADCTSLWAAATSMEPAIAIHLLACMLARAFDAKEATGIWFELVKERKKDIEASAGRRIPHLHTFAAAKQDISRSELATWDASARAWLRRADESKSWEMLQFGLIVNNVKLPYTAPGSTYEKAVSTWIDSMRALNDLLENKPQQASDRGILLAISSWHLYPNIIVFQSQATKIELKDALFPPSAVLTLGVEYKSQEPTAIRWSLALSHLRYYGDPVRVESKESDSRITMTQLWLILLGSILNSWEIKPSEIIPSVKWFQVLGQLLSRLETRELSKISWITSICDSVQTCSNGNDLAESSTLSIIKYGWRQGMKFRLVEQNQGIKVPFFRLSDPKVIHALAFDDGISRGITFLRRIASETNLDSKNFLISYRERLGNDSLSYDYWEWTTANSTVDGENTRAEINVHPPSVGGHRFIYLSWGSYHAGARDMLMQRKRYIERLGETCDIIERHEDMAWQEKISSRILVSWRYPHEAMCQDDKYQAAVGNTNIHRLGFMLWVNERVIHSMRSKNPDLAKTLGDSCKFMEGGVAATTIARFLNSFIEVGAPNVVLNVVLTLVLLQQDQFLSVAPRGKKRAYFESGSDEEEDLDLSFSLDSSIAKMYANITMTGFYAPKRAWIQSMRALEVATILYKTMPGATISRGVIGMGLNNAEWLPDTLATEAGGYATDISAEDYFNTMTRVHGLSCIAMFESGQFNLTLDKFRRVVALCVADSIYVSQLVFQDPLVQVEGPQIRHLVGSLGKRGMNLLVSPDVPLMKTAEDGFFRVNHEIYDGTRNDSFGGISMHLSFTESIIPIVWRSIGQIDQEIFFQESVVSVQCGGEWIADIDVMNLERPQFDIFIASACSKHSKDLSALGEAVSFDTWDELLDYPPVPGVFRARGNHTARIAAACILTQRDLSDHLAVIGGDEICWTCFAEVYSQPHSHIPRFIID